MHEAMERAWLRWGPVRTLHDPGGWVRTVAWRIAVSRWRRVRTGARLPADDSRPGLFPDEVAR